MTLAFATALLLLQTAPEAKSWEYQVQSAAPATAKKEAEQSPLNKVTLTIGASSIEWGSPQSLTKLSGGTVSSYESNQHDSGRGTQNVKVEFVSGEAKFKLGSEPVTSRKLKALPVGILAEMREGDPGCWAHIVSGDRIRKLERGKSLMFPVYSLSFGTHAEAQVQVLYHGEVKLEGTKGKVKTRRYEAAHGKTRWSLWADEDGSLAAMKAVAWARGDERTVTTYVSRSDLFDSPQVKDAPKD